jgi:hypothetical protein
MISGSTPFSLASASIVCCRGLVVMLVSQGLPRARLQNSRRAGARLIVASGIRCRLRPPPRTPARRRPCPRCGPAKASGRRAPDPRPAWRAARRTARSPARPQRPVEPWRRHLEGVRVSSGSSTSRIALISRLTCAQSSMPTLSSGVPDGPGRSMKTLTTQPIDSRRNWTSNRSRPCERTTRSATSRIRSTGFIRPAAASDLTRERGHEPHAGPDRSSGNY